jgi:glycosyltransferase involved in cell wall biosynthesis
LQKENAIKFSVIIPCYNQAHFLEECFDSILQQDYTNWEAIFINDGSTDETQSVIEKFASFDSRVVLHSKSNGGLSSARNAGISIANGDFFLWLDADDLLFKNCMASIFDAVQLNPNAKILQMGYTHISQNGKLTYTTVDIGNDDILAPNIYFENIGPPVSICLHSSIVKDVGYFDLTLKSCEDWDYWMRTTEFENNILKIQQPLVAYRMNENSMSKNSFVLYDAMKLVSVKGYNLVLTKANNSILNTSKIIFNTHIKKKLAMCLGVAICQTKIVEAVRLYEQEVKQEALQFQVNDFKQMSSYLTFRYQTDKISVVTILTKYKELFRQFFKAIGFSKSTTDKCIWLIFSKHYYLEYTDKFGFLGKLIFKAKDYWFKNISNACS